MTFGFCSVFTLVFNDGGVKSLCEGLLLWKEAILTSGASLNYLTNGQIEVSSVSESVKLVSVYSKCILNFIIPGIKMVDS